MARRRLALAGLCGLIAAFTAQAQQKATVYDPTRYVLVDARLFRGVVGYTTFGISNVDTLPDRAGQGIDLRIEARLISGFMKKEEGFVIADAFFLDLAMGMLSSEPLYYYDNPEDRFSSVASMGYSFLAGYSGAQFGALGGKRFAWTSAFVGGSTLPGADLFAGTAPWLARLEFRPAFSNEFRILLTAWDNFRSAKRDQGFRVDIPIHPTKRFYLTYSYSTIAADVSYATFDNGVYAPGTLKQQVFGVSFGPIH